MIHTSSDFVHNLNFMYMAALMTAPMLVLEIVLMRAMYPQKMLSILVVAVGIVLLIGSFLLIRQQTAIDDRAFLKSMIPHHSGAILMCQESSIQDPEVRALCNSIVQGQQQEIDQMRAILERLEQ